jgi:large conductance mechanosensitive channel
MKRFLGEFKKFALKGNMVDLAIGMIIGSAFTSIVNSIVNDLVMPVLSIFTGRMDFSNLFLALDGGHYATLAEVPEGVAVFNYGNFITNVLNFLIVALVLFLVVRKLNQLKKPAPAAEPATKECPFCKSEIHKDAVKCPYCGSEVE